MGVSADQPPPSLVFLEYLGLSQEMAEIGIDIDNVKDKSTPDSTGDPTDTVEPESKNQLTEKP